MTKFNPKNKKTLTYADTLGPAMEITNEEDAKQYFEAYVSFIQKALNEENDIINDMTAEEIALSNLGYYAGYYNEEVREQVERLFNCKHPILEQLNMVNQLQRRHLI